MFRFLENIFIKQPSSPCSNSKAENRAIKDKKSPQAPKQTSEYDVYVHYVYNPDKNKKAPTLKWRKVGATNNAKHAVIQARGLHRKQEYQQIEVKKRSYSKEQDCYLSKTIRVYKKKRPSAWENFIRSFSVS